MFLKVLCVVVILAGLLAAGLWWLAQVPVLALAPETIRYGVTFSKFRADELKIDWKETYDALLDDLGVRRLRLVAHWPMVEPTEDTYDFTALDYQMRRAEEVGAEVILAVGLRLPSWPECHVPDWAEELSSREKYDQFFQYVEAVIDRYKDSPALKWWQVENEPFIIGFAFEQCGVTDADFLNVEIGFVQAHDPDHPVLLTASGELGLWNGTWKRADVFGTTLYRHVYNAGLKRFIDYPTTPAFFRIKRKFTELTTGKPDTPAIIVELAAEPWPIKAIIDTPLSEQLERMNLEIFNDTVDFAAQTSFDEQYFWGAEWWYYLKTVHNDSSFWNRTKEFFHE